MTPILYGSTETGFTSNGLGWLTDAISCVVTEERNGAYELELTYPMSGAHYNDIALRCLILAKPNLTDDAQPFRIYEMSKPINGVVTIRAEHISYDLAGIPLRPFTVSNVTQAMSALKNFSVVENPFQFATDKTTVATMQLNTPASVRSRLGGVDGSVLDVYGGEWSYNGFNLFLHNARGANNGVSIRYGKNLVTLEQEENCSNVFTGVFPYYYSEQNGLVQGDVQQVAGTFDYTKILPLDLSEGYQEPPTVAELNAKARKYIADNNIGVPKVSITLSFVDISKASGYDSRLETVSLCDIVNVYFERLGIETTAKVVKTEFDALLEKYTSIEVGDARTNIADTIASMQTDIENAPTGAQMQRAITYATDLLSGAEGGHILIERGDDGKPASIFIMDTDDKTTARKVWRYNLSGWGVSRNGINGPYELAAVFDDVTGGHIVADFITAGTLNATNVNVTNINGQNVLAQTIGNSQIQSGSVQGSSGWGYTSIGGGSVGTGSIDGYCGGGVSGGWEAADAFAGRIRVNNLFAYSIELSNRSLYLGNIYISGQSYNVVRYI